MDSLDWNLVRSFAVVVEHGSLSAAARASCQKRSYQIVLTHDQDEAIELADRIVILNQGMIEQVDTLSKS